MIQPGTNRESGPLKSTVQTTFPTESHTKYTRFWKRSYKKREPPRVSRISCVHTNQNLFRVYTFLGRREGCSRIVITRNPFVNLKSFGPVIKIQDFPLYWERVVFQSPKKITTSG